MGEEGKEEGRGRGGRGRGEGEPSSIVGWWLGVTVSLDKSRMQQVGYI